MRFRRQLVRIDGASSATLVNGEMYTDKQLKGILHGRPHHRKRRRRREENEDPADSGSSADSELVTNDVWRGLTRKHFGFPLLTSSYNTMESGLGSSETCLACGGCLDPWGNHALFCDGGTWGVAHTFLKHAVKDFVVAVAAGSVGCVSNIVLEASGQLTSSDYRPGDVAGRVNGLQFAIDVFVTRVGSASNRGKSVDKVIEEADAVKRDRYAKLYKDSDVLFFTFGMDAEGRLGERAEETIR